jgi:hypothetical protein
MSFSIFAVTVIGCLSLLIGTGQARSYRQFGNFCIPCNDGDGCVTFDEVCDGIRQCADGSDEDPFGCAHCPEDFTLRASGCYKMISEEKSWLEASQHCSSLHDGAHLAFINDRREQRTVYRMLQAQHPDVTTWWIGGRSEGSGFFWVKHTPEGSVLSRPRMSYANWPDGEPNSQSTGEVCVSLRSQGRRDGRWNDVECDTPSKFVCEIDV